MYNISLLNYCYNHFTVVLFIYMNKMIGVIIILLVMIIGLFTYSILKPNNKPIMTNSTELDTYSNNLNLEKQKPKEVPPTNLTVVNSSAPSMHLDDKSKYKEILSLFYINIPNYTSEYQFSPQKYMIVYNNVSIIFRDYTGSKIVDDSSGEDILLSTIKTYKKGTVAFTGYEYYIGDSESKSGIVYTTLCDSRNIAIYVPNEIDEKVLDLSTFTCK